MGKTDNGGHRDEMRDHCAALMVLLSKYDRISIAELVGISGIKPHTVRRWMNSFSKTMDLRIEKGLVIIERI
ncbi:MAG: hypothetical protein WAN11_11655 [Syntrophobacteraceae bacterium]